MAEARVSSAGEKRAWSRGWTIGLRVWMERAGHVILGKGRLELLEGIERLHSISAAARQMGMSYRRAWELVQSINQAAGEPLVTAAVGGTRGGGARLTPLGREATATFRDLQFHVGRSAAGFLPQRMPTEQVATLHVLAAVSLEDVLGEVQMEYALRQPTVRVRTIFGASDELADHLLTGGPGDLFLTADCTPLVRLDQSGRTRPRGRVRVAENGLALIAPQDSRLAVGKPADLSRADVLRIAIGSLDCPLGRYTDAWLGAVHRREELAGRLVCVENSRAVVSAVRSGQADCGIAYSSDAARADGCRTVFQARKLPEPIIYFGTVLGGSQYVTEAKEFLGFLTSPAGRRCFRRAGFA